MGDIYEIKNLIRDSQVSFMIKLVEVEKPKTPYWILLLIVPLLMPVLRKK